MNKNIFLLVVFSFCMMLGINQETFSNNTNNNSANKNSTEKTKLLKKRKLNSEETLDKNQILIDSNSSNIKVDTAEAVVLPDRKIEFDLEKLSKMASLSVYGDKAHKANGLVLLSITIDEAGIVEKMLVKESEDPKLNLPAMKAIKAYIKKYKIQGAVKNGKPVKTVDLIVPVVFDMSLFDK